MDMITMSEKETNRLEMMEKIIDKRVSQKAASAGLGISVRHVKRLVKKYWEQGADWFGIKILRKTKQQSIV